MSVQADIEEAIASMLELAIPRLDAVTGPTTIPQIEGKGRAASVRNVTATGDRLEFGQTQWNETFALTVYWPAAVDRADSQVEWAAFATALLADSDLGGSIEGLEDAYLAGTTWGEATDAVVRTMSADVTVLRVE